MMTTLPLIQNNTCHCVWSRQSAELTVLEAVLLYSEASYGDISAVSAPANWLISVFPCLSGKAVTFRAWKNPSFAHPRSLCQNREQQSASAIPAFARASLNWRLNNTQSNIHDPVSHDCNSYGWKRRVAATFAPNPSTGRSIRCPLMLCLSEILLLDTPVSPDTFLTDIAHFSIPVYNVSDTVRLSYSSRIRPMRRKTKS